MIDLTDMNDATLKPLSWAQTNSRSGTLTVSDGVHTAAITLLRAVHAADFVSGFDGASGTAVTYHIPQETQLTTSHA